MAATEDPAPEDMAGDAEPDVMAPVVMAAEALAPDVMAPAVIAALLEELDGLPEAAVELLEPQALAARARTANPAITPDRLKVLRVVTTRTSSSSGHRLLAERHSRT
jgi:hypothetical protein